MVLDVSGEDVAWLQEHSGHSGTLGFVIPARFEVYGVIDLPEEISPDEDALLTALAPDPACELIAGWIDRGPWPPPPGDELLLGSWRYRFRRLHAAQLRGLPSEAEGSFPDLVFPPDRTWLVSLQWDDSWRSVGANETVAQRLEQHGTAFHRLDPTTSLATTGRIEN